MEVTVAPIRQPLGEPVTLTVTVRSSSGAGIEDATVKIENFGPTPPIPPTDATGVVSFTITFKANKEIDPENPTEHEWIEVALPSGEVTKEGFQSAILPLDFSTSPTPTPLEPVVPKVPVASKEVGHARRPAGIGLNLRTPPEWDALRAGLEKILSQFGAEGATGSVGALCVDHLTPQLKDIQFALRALGMAAFGFPGALMFFAAADSIDRIGVDHKLGDVVADALNVGPPEIIDQLISAVIDEGQKPWLVHGRRWEIADTFDYENDCYRGDSVEIFLAANNQLPDKVEQVFGVFDSLRARNMPLAAYISLRFMAPSKSLLGMAAFAPISCAIEISMLRGGKGNTWALGALQDVAIRNDGRIHWGQQNDLDSGGVHAMYGRQFDQWRRSLEEVEGRSPTFSNPFSVSHGLEPFPAAIPVMEVTVEVDPPGNIPLEQEVIVTVRAKDTETHASVPGTIRIMNFGPTLDQEVSEHDTDKSFLFTFRAGPAEGFTPETRRATPGDKPSGVVAANEGGYSDTVVPFKFK
jgi:hypothetical protein